MKKVVFAYLPAYHSGVEEFINKHFNTEESATLILLDRNMHQMLPQEFDHIGRDIRAIAADKMIGIVRSQHHLVGEAYFLSKDELRGYQKHVVQVLYDAETIITTEDDFSVAVLSFLGVAEDKIVMDDSVFIRWSKNTVPNDFPITPDLEISEVELFRTFMEISYEESEKSSDWWRRVGVVIFNDKEILFCKHNRHLPTKNTPNIDGDIRSNFGPGEEIDKCQAIHAEASAIACAARDGVALEGASILVTTFPCGGCAQLIFESGIKTVYFREGYSSMDTAKLLFQEQGIRIVLVN